ncbi:MAG: YceI family protein [Oceanidesulfovibrio sp.]
MEPAGMQTLTARELVQWQNEGRPFNIVNVLPAEEWAKRRIPGSKNACVYEVTFISQMREIAPDKNAPLVIQGAGADTLDGPMAAEKLLYKGWSDVHLLVGGLDAWAAEGFTLEGTHATIPDMPEDVFEPRDGGYAVDIDESLVEWTGRSPKGRHVGTVKLSHGKLQVREGALNGLFELDMSTIDNIDLREDEELRQMLHAHLASEDFFLTSLFPTAKYVLDSGTMLRDAIPGSPNYEFHGRLELRGASHALSFPATVRPFAGDLLAGLEPGISVEAHFDLDRTKWGAVYGSGKFFRHLGYHLVYDLVSFEIRLVVR